MASICAIASYDRGLIAPHDAQIIVNLNDLGAPTVTSGPPLSSFILSREWSLQGRNGKPRSITVRAFQ